MATEDLADIAIPGLAATIHQDREAIRPQLDSRFGLCLRDGRTDQAFLLILDARKQVLKIK